MTQGSILLIPRVQNEHKGHQEDKNGHTASFTQIKDLFLGYAVLDTAPIMQGYIHEQTQIYILDEFHSLSISSESTLSKLRNFYNERIGSDRIPTLSIDKKDSILSYKLDILDSFTAVLPFGKLCSESFQLKQLNHPLANPQPEPSYRDIDIEIGVTMKTLRKLGVLSGGWVLISNTEKSDTKRVCRIYALDPPPKKESVVPIFDSTGSEKVEFDDSAVYVSPLIYFTMNLDSLKSSKVSIKNVTSEMESFLGDKIDPSRELKGTLSWSTEAHISRVYSPNMNITQSCRNALRSHFKHPRIYRVGDVFGVTIFKKKFISSTLLYDSDESDSDDETLDSMQKLKESKLELDVENDVVSHVAYFKLVSTSGKYKEGSFAVDIEKTTLFQEGFCNSTIPSNYEDYIQFAETKFSIKNTLSHSSNLMQYNEYAYNKLISFVEPCLNAYASKIGLYLSVIISGKQGVGKKRIIRNIANKFGIHIVEFNCYDVVGNFDKHSETRTKKIFQEAQRYSPCILILKNVDAFDKANPDADVKRDSPYANALRKNLQEIPQMNSSQNYPLLVISTTDDIESISPTIRSCFKHEIHIPVPTEDERLNILRVLTSKIGLCKDVSIKSLAQQTASFLRRDLITLMNDSVSNAMERVLDYYCPKEQGLRVYADIDKLEHDICSAGVNVMFEDVEKALRKIQQSNISNLGAPRIPTVKWDDVGGLQDVKKEILDTIQLPLRHPELFASGVNQRSGILLYGPPGTGKTLMAKAIATECNINFISVKGPELINMYVGESEKNIRELFQKARDARPCIIFFDELDSLAPNRGISGDSGGVMDRIVSQLLAELSSLNNQNSVFVIGATNRPDLIDPALLIPGRFDKLLYLGINQDVNQKAQILKALTRKLHVCPNVNLQEIAELCPTNLTGADMYALCSDAHVIAVAEEVDNLEKGDPSVIEQLRKSDTTKKVIVKQVHFTKALENLTPSVSKEELKRYELLAKQFM